jgi:hypothetical protein
MRRVLLALALAAMMAVVPACAAVAAPTPDAGPPIGGCPGSEGLGSFPSRSC